MDMENKIRVNSGIVVEVNDNGDTITVNAEDYGFIDKFFSLNENLEKITKEMNALEVKEKGEREQLHCLMDKTKEIMADIDALFGENTCKKVFGDIIPNPYLIADFFEQLTPIAKQYMDVRQKKIAEKYSNNRKGARSKKYRTKEEIIQDAMR